MARVSRQFPFNRLRAVVFLAAFGALAGCSTTVKVPIEPLPKALVQPFPINAAIRFDDALVDYSYEELMPTGESYRIDIGEATQSMLMETFQNMFEGTAFLKSGEPIPRVVDLLIEPSIQALEFALPSQTVTKDYAVWMKFAMKVYDSNGKIQREFPVSAYGKATAESIITGQGTALQSAATRALRDASVLLLTKFAEKSELSAAQLGLADIATLPVAEQNSPSPPSQESEPELESGQDSANAGEQFL